MRYLAPVILIATCVAGFSSDFRPFDGPKPLAVLIGTDPWAMVIGSDTPHCAIYEDHAALFARPDGIYRHQLTDQQFAELMKHVTPVMNLKSVKSYFDLAPNITDQPEAKFYFDIGGKTVATTVYGLMPADTRLSAHTVFPGSKKSDKLPTELGRLYEFLLKLDYPHSERWTPKYIEVMIWPYEYAPDESIKWPAGWPQLDSERASKRGDSYSIFLDGQLLPQLERFVRSRKERGAVELGGHKWAIEYRYVFPSEPIWHKALERRE